MLAAGQPLGHEEQASGAGGVRLRRRVRLGEEPTEQELVGARTPPGERAIAIRDELGGIGWIGDVERRGHDRVELGRDISRHRRNEGLAAREALVERWGPDPDSVGDGLHSDGFEAALLEEGPGRRQDRRPGRPRRGRTHRPIRPRWVSLNPVWSFSP